MTSGYHFSPRERLSGCNRERLDRGNRRMLSRASNAAGCLKNAFDLVEPVRQYSDEGCTGLQLGCRKRSCTPAVPGPGWLCEFREVTPERLRILRDADTIV